MKNGHAQTVGTQTCRVRNKVQTFLGIIQLASVGFVLIAFAGCAGVVSGSKQNSTSASFQLSPATVNFGQVTVGKQATQSVSVSNTGNMAVNITQISVSNSRFSVSGMTTPMAIAVGQTASFTVAVNPTATGSLTGTLTAQGDGGSTPAVINLSATAVSGAQSQLSLNQSSVNFGSVSVGSKGTSNLVLSNTGTTDLTVSLLTLSGADFTISGITTPKTIPAGQSAQLVVTFTPAAAGSATGSLAITSSDPVNPNIAVPLSGNGTSAATGQLSANPTSLSFGTIGTGTSSTKQVVITNNGNAAVNISNVTSNGTGLAMSGITAPSTLNPSQSATLTVSFTPSSAGAISGSISILSNAGNSPLTIAVSGTAAQPGLSISPASFNFGSIVDGQTKSQTITVTNTGTAALTIAELSASGAAFSVNGMVTPATIQAGGSSTFSVLFAPTTAGSQTGTVSITSNAPNSPNVLALSGSGTAASVTLSTNPGTLTFSNVSAGTSSSKTLTITNSGNTSLTVSQVSVNAKDFSVSGMTAPVTLAAGQNTAMTVTFSPSSAENITGNITVASSEGANAVVAVSGTGVQAGLTITPASASFGSVTVGSPSSQTIQLLNSGTGTLTVSQVSVAGTGFSTGTLALPLNIAAGNSANLTVQFAPTSAGAASGSITVVSNAPNSPALVALSGTGVAATQTLSFSTTNVAFGNVNIGSPSTQNVTITNSGNASVTVSQITESGSGFTLSGAGTPVTLSSGQSLTFGVVYNPSAAGSNTGTVTVTSTASGSPTSIALSGTGVQTTNHTVTLAWVASTSTVSGYNIYRSTTSGSGYAKINSGLVSSLTYEDSTVQSGTTYYYVVTAVDSTGDESNDSNQATAVIP